MMEKSNIFMMADYLFLGYHMMSYDRMATSDIYVKESNNLSIANMNNELNIGAGFAYSINKNGAQKLVDYIEKNGIKHGIDYVVKICDELKSLELRPQIVFSEWMENPMQEIDTDIQKDFTFIKGLTPGCNMLEFTFIPGLDHVGDDILFIKDPFSLEEFKQIALLQPNCIGFNTLGFFKNKIDMKNLQPSKFFKEKDGLYVRNMPTILTVNNCKKIKLIGNWQSCQKMAEEFGVMSHEGFELTYREKADYYAIVNFPDKEVFYEPQKTIIFQMEPSVGVKTWGQWSTPDPEKFLHINSHNKFLNPAQWSFDISSLTLDTQKKDKVVSIMSFKKNDVGHIYRIQFVRENGSIDVYGVENYHNFTSWVGPVTNDNRGDVYSKYKYVLAVENNSELNYATEKIWEALICECLPFYWGCPNLENYIDATAFVRLPLEDMAESVRIVEQAIREDWWSQRIDAIKEAKKKILSDLGFFPVIKKITELQSKPRTLYIGGCVKNCGLYLDSVFENMKKIIGLFDSYQIVIAYDKSDDNSLSELNRLSKTFDVVIIDANGKSLVRCENISNARNMILKYLKDRPHKYFIMMDMDDVCVTPINLPVLKKSLEREDWDCLTFNRSNYYDIWALSIDKFRFSCWHFNDIYREIKMRNYIENKLKNTDKNSLVKCESAFNGFAIYRPEKFASSSYSARIEDSLSYMKECDLEGTHLNNLHECEHRPFHLSAKDAIICISPLILFDLENSCKFISSRGILQSCKIKSSKPISSIKSVSNYDFSVIQDGDTVYICSNAIREFMKILDFIRVKFVLVSGDCDELVPDDCFNSNDEFKSFIESDKIIHWYAQNCIGSHPKLSGIPIGLDYHTVRLNDHMWSPKMSSLMQEDQLILVNSKKLKFSERILGCYANFHFSVQTRFGNDRVDAMKNIQPQIIFYEKEQIPRLSSWENQAKYAFVLSPHGGGLDCHRTWEALCLGSIPIVKKSPICYLFENLPVLIVDEWSEVTFELLQKTVTDFSSRNFEYSKLTLEYWIKKITIEKTFL